RIHAPHGDRWPLGDARGRAGACQSGLARSADHDDARFSPWWADLVARIVADGLTRRLGQRIVIESKPGASGTTAAALVARAAPDGYTLFAIPSGHAFAAATYKTLPYRTIDDFAMISMFTEYPYLLATYADHSMRTVADLIALARTRSTPLLYGTPGNGS